MTNRINPFFWDENEGDETNPFNNISQEEVAKTSARLHYAFYQMMDAVHEAGLDEANARRAVCVFFLMRIRQEGMELDLIRNLIDKIENRGK